MGGDHFQRRSTFFLSLGSPPHGRGPRQGGVARRQRAGLTPAWAGTTRPATAPASCSRAHPRMGGDHVTSRRLRPGASGSPPHGRGPLAAGGDDGPEPGLTPAWAGTTGKRFPNRLLLGGSPPHGRGPRDDPPRRRPPLGLTPAWAGTTTSSPEVPGQFWAHPRMGGDHGSYPTRPKQPGGSPPHGRGPQRRHRGVGRREGLTPAWAGTTDGDRAVAGDVEAHPRMGGDHLGPPRAA